MSKPSRTAAQLKAKLNRVPSPPAPAADIEAQAAAARTARVAQCEREVLAALEPILARYRCRLGTVQQVVDGVPGPVQVRVFALDG